MVYGNITQIKQNSEAEDDSPMNIADCMTEEEEYVIRETVLEMYKDGK